MHFSKKIIFGLFTSIFITTAYAAPKEQVFIGEFSMRSNNVGIIETLPKNEITSALSDMKYSVLKKHITKYVPADLYIDFNTLGPWYKQQVLKHCNDGQLCKITATTKKEANEEATKYHAIDIKHIEVLKAMD